MSVLRHLICLSLFLSQFLIAMNKDKELYDLPLEELLKVKIAIASNSPLKIAQQPSIVSIITREQILSSGAQDLFELLQQEPGFWLIQDVLFGMGPSVRGASAFEGKVLVMVDGIEINSIDAGIVDLGNNIPLQIIDSIEIIRGPGSVKYGGNAEVSVIKVKTLAYQRKDHHIAITHESTSDTVIRNRLDYVLGQSLGDSHVHLTLSLFEGALSDQTFTDMAGNTFEMDDLSKRKNYRILGGIKSKNYKVNLQHREYSQEDETFITDLSDLRDNEAQVSESALIFEGIMDLGTKIRVRPQLKVRRKTFDYLNSAANNKSFWEQAYHEYTLALNAHYTISDSLNFLSGLEHTVTEAKALSSNELAPPAGSLYYGKDSLKFEQRSLFLQAEYHLDRTLIVTAGGRYQFHESLKNQFIPRLSLVKQHNKLHFKLITSEAFRYPNVDIFARNRDQESSIVPEKSRTIEFELGYRMSEDVLVTSNFYLTRIDDYIAFDPTPLESVNVGSFLSEGAEMVLLKKIKSHEFKATYSYTRYSGDDDTPIVGEDGSTLGHPKQKLGIFFARKLGNGRQFSLFANHLKDVSGYKFDGGAKNLVSKDFNLLNLSYRVQWEDVALTARVRNVLDDKIAYYQYYDGNGAPVPAPSRSYLLSVERSL